MMMTLACGPKGPGSNGGEAPKLDIKGQLPTEPGPFKATKSLTEILNPIPLPLCFEFAHEFLKKESGNFTRTALTMVADDLVAQYFCSSDNQTYTIKITPSK
jgi:hypothetical protein